MQKKIQCILESEGLTDILPCGLYVIRDLVIVDCNKAAVSLFRYDSKDEMIGLKLWELSPEKQRDGSNSILEGQNILKDAINTKNYTTFQWVHKKKTGETFLSHVSICNKKGNLYVSITDINELDRLRRNLDEKESVYHALFQDHNSVMLVINPETGNIAEANQAAIKYYGYTKEELLNMNIKDINILSEDQIQNEMNRAVKARKTYFQFIHQLATGEQREVEVHSFPVKTVKGKLLFSIIHDVSDEKYYERQLYLFRKILENNSEGVVITDNKGCIQWINNAFTEITGYLLEEIAEKKMNILKSGVHDENFYKEMWSRLLHKDKWCGEIWNKNKEGHIYSEWLTISSIKNDFNKKKYYVGIFKDLSQKKKIDRRMIELQQKDILTGAYNRNYFIKTINKYIEDYEEIKEDFSIIAIDIEGFKEINDSLGYVVGDKLLIELSERIASFMNNNCVLARFDGDKFAIQYRGTSKEDVKKFTKTLLSKINQPFQYENVMLHLNFHIGVSRFPQDGDNAEALVRYVNIAMNKAKNHGGERICFYSTEMSDETKEKFYLANYLVGAISKNEFFIHYQPIFDIKQRTIVGAEALLRWNNPVLGMITPDKFIPMAEKTGEIIPVGFWVIREVCKQINLWHDKGYQSMPISINVSVKQLEQRSFSKTVIDILKENKVQPNHIELEITESVSLGDIDTIVRNLKELKKSGFKISMDDFGTGFSSLGQLNLFELDKLKIDKVFVNDLVKISKRRNLVQSIIAMAKSLDLSVVAEGIETKEQVVQLQKLGCQLGQGYLFSKPIPPEEIVPLLKPNKKCIMLKQMIKGQTYRKIRTHSQGPKL